GNPTELTMIELARVVLDLTGSTSNVVFHPLPSDDPRRRRPDISLVTSALGWRPEISVIDGLSATVEAMRVEVGV
ncbi:MAG: SDR family NAD-dependent epimerase/dehydratase, partial [Actinomycetota bacterium]|nr:SDR family NAD-dependent epimerase/dehydratase [Actinomycetota bacterium]